MGYGHGSGRRDTRHRRGPCGLSEEQAAAAPEALEDLLDKIAKGQKVKPGPQIDRTNSAPQGGPTSLTGDVTAKPAKKVAKKKPASKATKKAVKVPPANAARPKQDAAITSKAIKSPARKPVKAAAATKAASKTKPAGPERLKKPAGKADDLKLISGVGPKLEGTLNKLGFWHFSQIAKWTKKDIAVVDDELSFKGRIERDDWVKQAKALAKGGEAEYIKVFGKKPR